ncbi:type II secretion system minor pseudopilin GspI [Alteromonas sp. a30]|uniref:type II secretion system minor pseudopilin GspI n=1 Tax=Alteromonas sp. a30 TaxID=2730917 RepID=UPI00227F2C7E|nr:type II secretion system minor pseudopilin GspI [Alteromonas sp. a30]MCY7295667.1 type II secretion system minor pseudopilin GspI [Alteromonas sp. a30]
MKMNKLLKKIKGMTLVEVMVALFIFAFSSVSVMNAVTEHLRGVSVLQDLTFATWVANNRLTQLSLEEKWPPQNNAKGAEEMAGATWYWQQKTVETQEKDMLSIEVRVSSDEAGENIITSVTTFLSRPVVGARNAR